MGDLTADADKALKLCQDWANATQPLLQVQLFLFGSVIYKGGEQFDPITSDIDVVAILPPNLDAVGRAALLQKLQERKVKLELDIIPGLGRPFAGEPGVSLVPITQLELQTNVHKSGVRRFFDRNIFLDLMSGIERLGLPGAGSGTLPEEHRAALEYVQKLRNVYLGKAANLAGGLSPYSGSDPMPKALLRAAAQLDLMAAEGEWYDTRLGLELMFDRLRDRRTQPAFRELFDRVSTRRGARGSVQPLSDEDQILLVELLYDLAANVQIDDVVQWELRIPGGPFDDSDADRFVNAVRAVAPDAILVRRRFGSIILRFQSSRARFETLRMLHEKGLLQALLGTDRVQLHLVDSDSAVIASVPVGPTVKPGGTLPFAVDRDQVLYDAISRWKPASLLEADAERELAAFIKTEIDNQSIPDAQVVSNPAVALATRVVRPDVVVYWNNTRQPGVIGVELITLGALPRFFNAIERASEMPFQVIIVVVGSEDRISRVREDAERLKRVGGHVQVVLIPGITR